MTIPIVQDTVKCFSEVYILSSQVISKPSRFYVKELTKLNICGRCKLFNRKIHFNWSCDIEQLFKRQNRLSSSFICIPSAMAHQLNFEQLLEKKYPSFTVEVNAFLDSCSVSCSSDVAMNIIYQRIRRDDKVDGDLKALYHEAIFGNDRNVRSRIRNRITHFRRTLRYYLMFTFLLFLIGYLKSD